MGGECLERLVSTFSALHTGEVSPLEGSAGFKFIFSAHMNAMAVKIFVGTKKMCIFHEPKKILAKYF